MSDTTEQECACCGFDTDCIQGLCSSCYDYNCEIEKLNKQLIKSIRNKPITEHPDVQRLIGQVVELQKNLEVWREACGNNEKRIEELQAENKSKDKLIKSLDSL